MTVISDASPLHYLVLIAAEHVLAQLFSEVVVPPAVLRELSHHKAPEPVRRWVAHPPQWLRVMEPSNTALDEKLGDGESAAISLAIEIQARALLIDEREGTRIANRLGIATVGTLGILSMAAEKKMVSLEKAFAALQQTSFRVRPSLLAALLTHHQTRSDN
jgi:predicted nucleic acid-binding protein